MNIFAELQRAWEAGAEAREVGRNKDNSHHRFFSGATVAMWWWDGYEGRAPRTELTQVDFAFHLETLARDCGAAVAGILTDRTEGSVGFGLLLFDLAREEGAPQNVLTWTSNARRNDMMDGMETLLRRWKQTTASELTPGEGDFCDPD